MTAKAIIVLGPIASGKGTQADILAKKYGFFHLETARVLEEKFKNASADDRELQARRQEWSSGLLVDPVWVAEIISEEMKTRAARGEKLVFSGSPRSLWEAEKELPVLESFFGKKGVVVFELKLSEAEVEKRSLSRRICQKNRHPIPDLPQFKDLQVCPEDGSQLQKKVLDNPRLIKIRFQEYQTRTQPVIDYLRRQGYTVIEINGESPIEKVAADISSYLDDHP